LQLVIRGKLLLFGFAIGHHSHNDDDGEQNSENDGDDVQQMVGAVEGTRAVVGVDGAVGFLREKRCGGSDQGGNGGDAGANAQSENLGRFDLRSWAFYDGGAADVAAFISAPLDAVSPPGGVAQMVRATDS
jgi:hypothetical protein